MSPVSGLCGLRPEGKKNTLCVCLTHLANSGPQQIFEACGTAPEDVRDETQLQEVPRKGQGDVHVLGEQA